MAKSQREKAKEQARKTSAAEWSKKQSETRGPTAVKLPEGVEWFDLTEDVLSFDIMPYIVGDAVRNPSADAGFQHWELTYAQHSVPEADGGFGYKCCCLREVYDAPCPVCKMRNELPRVPKGESDPLQPQRRNLFWVNDKPGKLKNPLKVLSAAYFNRGFGFGQQLKVAIDALRGDKDFFDLKTGQTLRVAITNKKYRQVGRIDFQPREYEYPDDMLERTSSLEAMLIRPDPKKLTMLLNAGSVDAEDHDDDEAPRRSRASDNGDDEDAAPTKAHKDADDDKDTTEPAEDFVIGGMVMYKKKECEITAVSSKGLLALEDEEGTAYAKIKPSDVTRIQEEEDTPEDDDDDKDDAPAPKRKASAVKEDDESDDEDDEEPEEDEDDGDDEDPEDDED